MTPYDCIHFNHFCQTSNPGRNHLFAFNRLVLAWVNTDKRSGCSRQRFGGIYQRKHAHLLSVAPPPAQLIKGAQDAVLLDEPGKGTELRQDVQAQENEKGHQFAAGRVQADGHHHTQDSPQHIRTYITHHHPGF